MDTNNLISKKQIKETYQSYTEYFNEIMKKVVEKLQNNINRISQDIKDNACKIICCQHTAKHRTGIKDKSHSHCIQQPEKQVFHRCHIIDYTYKKCQQKCNNLGHDHKKQAVQISRQEKFSPLYRQCMDHVAISCTI